MTASIKDFESAIAELEKKLGIFDLGQFTPK